MFSPSKEERLECPSESSKGVKCRKCCLNHNGKIF